MTTQTSGTTKTKHLEALTGPLPVRMTNDYLFKYLLQSEEDVLKALICSYRDLDPNDIRSIHVMNAIQPAENLADKEMILDIKAEMNDNTIVNLEMQVINNHDWPERSLSYLCRCFDSLKHGEGYYLVKEVHHIGFLDYTLFPESPEFYSTYRMKNDRTGQIYSGKFSISVVDLKHIDLATTEDKQKHRDLWASFFKANSWEELIMLAKQDSNIKKAAAAVYTLTQDEIFRQQCEAREDFLRQQIDHDAWFENKFKAQEAALAKQEATLAKQEATIATQEATIATLTETLAEHDAKHEEELKKQSAQHDKELKKRDATISALQTSLSDLRQTVLELQQQITT